MSELIRDLEVMATRGDPDRTEVSGIELDSRAVDPGALFCCVPGEVTDGHLHAGEAVARGAVALLCEHPLDLDVPQVQVPRVRPAMALASSTFYGHPSRTLTTVGVTGTNGKTTVTRLVGDVLERAGVPTGVLGTLGGLRTTPEAPELQRRLAQLVSGGRRAVALEVSSHALTQHRVDGIVFDVAAFTNLSRDHLDHHGSMEAYFEAKASLFGAGRAEVAVVWVDDPAGRRLAGRLDDGGRAGGPRLVPVRRADATDITPAVGTTSFTWRDRRVDLPLTGTFNVDNALVAAAVAVELGVDEEAVAAGLTTARPVPGRMQVVATGPVSVVVDYAHTPAGLGAALSSLRAAAPGARLVCVFGCGGDRDRGKRPQMGSVASRLADVVVLTSDNPRSEAPLAIIDDIARGVDGGAEVRVEPDRGLAIRAAVAAAGDGDVVLVAGKGHETTQTEGAVTRPFDDRVVAAGALSGRAGDAPR